MAQFVWGRPADMPIGLHAESFAWRYNMKVTAELLDRDTTPVEKARLLANSAAHAGDSLLGTSDR